MLETAKSAAKKAGDYLLSNFSNIKEVVSKGDRNLATDLDREAERIVADILTKEFPEHGIIAEEAIKKNTDRDYLWIIDPLDGTHNFIRGIDIFGVSIGLWYKDDFILGVVYIPGEKEMYWAQKGKGAFKNGQSITVSNTADIKMASGSFDSSIRYAPGVMLKALGNIACSCFNIRMFGSSARALTYLAEGKLDFVVEFHDRPWDYAGSVCIIKEAGGTFQDLKGNALSPRTIGYIASSVAIYSELEQIVKQAFE